MSQTGACVMKGERRSRCVGCCFSERRWGEAVAKEDKKNKIRNKKTRTSRGGDAGSPRRRAAAHDAAFPPAARANFEHCSGRHLCLLWLAAHGSTVMKGRRGPSVAFLRSFGERNTPSNDRLEMKWEDLLHTAPISSSTAEQTDEACFFFSFFPCHA